MVAGNSRLHAYQCVTADFSYGYPWTAGPSVHAGVAEGCRCLIQKCRSVPPKPGCLWTATSGAAKDDAKGLARAEVRCARRRFDVDRYSSSLQTDDIVCTARENGFIVGTMTVRFDREQPLNADQIFAAELNQWRRAGVGCSLAVWRWTAPRAG